MPNLVGRPPQVPTLAICDETDIVRKRLHEPKLDKWHGEFEKTGEPNFLGVLDSDKGTVVKKSRFGSRFHSGTRGETDVSSAESITGTCL